MADIKDYTSEKEKRIGKRIFNHDGLELVKSEGEEDFRKKLRKHRLTFFYRILLCVLVVAAIFIIVFVQYKNKTYTDYDVISSSSFGAANGTTSMMLGKRILTYSKDGAYCTDIDGNVLWNQTYEMQSPIVRVCDGVTAIADYNGGTIYLLDSEKQLGTITTTLPIRDITVASNGVVAAVLDDSKITWVYIYDTTGTVIAQFKTTMDKTGYPISVSLSKDALLCTVSYIYIDAGVVKSRVAFYNFDEYGKNQIDNFVGGYDYTDTIIPYVQFMNNTTVFAAGDDSLMFYSGSQKPELLSVYYFDRDVRSIFYNEDYVGIVFYDEGGDDRYKIDIYNKSGEKVSSRNFHIDYTDIVFSGNTYIIYNETECLVSTIAGSVKYDGSFKKSVSLLIPEKGDYHYLLINTESLDTIQLK